MAETRGRPVACIGPIPFEGPAVEQDAKFREDNNHPPVDVGVWYQNTLAQKADMEAAEAQLFEELEKRR